MTGGEHHGHRPHGQGAFMIENLQATDPEDVKIISLARASLARSQAREAACVRDTDGRTYAGASVDLPHLRLSAIAVAVAMAVSSGAPGLEAVALAGETHPSEEDLALINDLPGDDVAVWSVDAAGAVRGVIEA
jgi:cytidine deaminase